MKWPSLPARPPTARFEDRSTKGLQRKELVNYEEKQPGGVVKREAEKAPVAVVVTHEAPGVGEDNDESFIVQASAEETPGVADATGEPGEHGQLVRRILETKKALELGLDERPAGAAAAQPVVVDAGERERSRQHSAQLQVNSNFLSKSFYIACFHLICFLMKHAVVQT